MGGFSYSRDTYSSGEGRTYSDHAQTTFSKVRGADPSVLIDGERRVGTNVQHPIVIALDVTGSMGESAKIMFDKIPMFWGQIEQRGYLKDFAISFAAVGDAYTDSAPLQVTQFEQGKKIDDWLSKIWLEGGGGGQTMESYDLAALFYLTRCSTPNSIHGFFFFIGDEGFYPEMDGKDTIPIFEELSNRFDLFFIHWPYNGGSSPIDDERIIKNWRSILGERFLLLEDPKAIVDVMLGLIAMRMGKNIREYEKDMEDKGQTKSRIHTVNSVIKEFNKDNLPIVQNTDLVKYNTRKLLPNRDPFRNRKGR